MLLLKHWRLCEAARMDSEAEQLADEVIDQRRDVRFWHKADVLVASGNVPFWG
jgi:hypothetical protein